MLYACAVYRLLQIWSVLMLNKGNSSSSSYPIDFANIKEPKFDSCCRMEDIQEGSWNWWKPAGSVC